MEFGLIIDTRGHVPPSLGLRGPEKIIEWVRGTPKKSWWDMSFKADHTDRLQVASLRCTQCGYLELYAPAPRSESE
jgi:hypothetical protein